MRSLRTVRAERRSRTPSSHWSHVVDDTVVRPCGPHPHLRRPSAFAHRTDLPVPSAAVRRRPFGAPKTRGRRRRGSAARSSVGGCPRGHDRGGDRRQRSLAAPRDPPAHRAVGADRPGRRGRSANWVVTIAVTGRLIQLGVPTAPHRVKLRPGGGTGRRGGLNPSDHMVVWVRIPPRARHLAGTFRPAFQSDFGGDGHRPAGRTGDVRARSNAGTSRN